MADNSDVHLKPTVLNTIYPDASAIFSFGPARLAEIIDNGMIVLDTNALLVPYKTGRASLDEIKKTFTKLISAKRLVVPGQVAREFAKHRPEQLKNLYQQIAARRQGQPKKEGYPLLAELNEYKKVLESDEKVEKALEASRKATDALLSTVKSWLWNDPISSLYRELFKDGVIVDPPIKEGFDDDLQRRSTNKIPPGYKDAGKDDGGPGDLLIWHTILHVGQLHKKHAMFVTGEEKSDWWHRSSDGPLYPRYELLEEYRGASIGQTFHIMTFAELLKQFGAKEEVVEEVRREQIAIKDEVIAAIVVSPRRERSERAVGRWLGATFTTVMETDAFPHFWAELSSVRVGVEVKLIGLRRKLAPKLDQVIAASRDIRIGQKGRMMVVFVAQNRDDAVWADNLLRGHLRGMSVSVKRLEIVVGYLKAGEFKETSRIDPRHMA
jgi:rRNA-processing protein FCF1